VSSGGATWTRAQGEREGEVARLKAQMSRVKWASGVRALKGSGCAEVAGKCEDMGASTAGVGGREVRDEGPDSWGPRGRDREDERVCEGIGADRPAPQSSERERERARVGYVDRRGPPVSAGWANWLGPNGFSLFPRISNGFSILFSLGFSIQIQIKFQIQTKSNLCNNSKNIWSSACVTLGKIL
jgi:hypothetical protein